MDNKRKHLEIIQGVINRLAQHSFTLKGWSMALFAGFLAVSSSGDRALFVLLAYFPVCMFWGLDAYFLRQERLYRKLYDHVRGLGETQIDFSMDTRPWQSDPKDKWDRVLISKTLLPFHGVLALCVAAGSLLVKHG